MKKKLTTDAIRIHRTPHNLGIYTPVNMQRDPASFQSQILQNATEFGKKKIELKKCFKDQERALNKH